MTIFTPSKHGQACAPTSGLGECCYTVQLWHSRNVLHLCRCGLIMTKLNLFRVKLSFNQCSVCSGFHISPVFWSLPLFVFCFIKQNVEVSRMSKEALLTVPAHQWGSTPLPTPTPLYPPLRTLNPSDAQWTCQNSSTSSLFFSTFLRSNLSSPLLSCFFLHLYFKTWWWWW